MSHYRRLAAAGISLAFAGIFITAPAQAAGVQQAAQPSSASVHGVSGARTAASKAAADIAGSAAESGYKSFSSTAKTAGHTAVSARPVLPEGAKAASASSVIYVDADPDHCTTELGTGTYDDPYCLLQSAVNAAVSGDTIQVWQNSDEDLEYNEAVVVDGKSNLTIVGEGTGVGDAAQNGYQALEIEYSSNITVRNLVLDSSNANAVVLYQSSGVTLDGDNLLNEAGPYNALTVGAGMSDVSVTRSTLGVDGGGIDVQVEPDVQNTVLASDIMSGGYVGVSADTVAGLDVVGDTIERECGSAVGVSDESTAVSIEDNVFEGGAATTASCAADNVPYSPDVAVDAAAAPGTTTDYNDFIYTVNSEAYSWSGTTYPTLAAFQAVVSQGAHDAVDPTGDAEMFLSPAGVDASGTPMTADAAPVGNSLSIGTANTSAPGYLSTDFYNHVSYDDRGAIEYVAPSLTAELTVEQTSARGVRAYADGSVEPDAYALYTFSWGDGTSSSGPATAAVVSHTYAHPGTYNVTVTVTDAFDDTSTATVSGQTAGGDYTPVGPVRILDTRKGIGTGTIASVGSGKTLSFQVAGVGDIPSDAIAVALNITVADEQAGGHINAYAAGTTLPITSNVDFAKGQNIANMAVVAVGAGGAIDLYNGSAGTVDLIADASGYFTATQTDGYKSLTPARLLDTRTTTGGHDAPVTATDSVKLKVVGVGGVPTDAKAVALNLTVASPTKAGYISAYPDGGSKPAVSNVNFVANQVIANAAIVPVGTDGDIDIALNGAGSARVVVDVDGYFSANTAEANSAYVPITPERYLDSRTIKNGTLQSLYYYRLPLGTDFWGNVLPTVTGFVTNTTVTGTTGGGYLTVFPENFASNGDLVIPSASSLNFTKGATVQNMVLGTPGTDGIVDFLNDSGGSLQLIVDFYGYFQNG